VRRKFGEVLVGPFPFKKHHVRVATVHVRGAPRRLRIFGTSPRETKIGFSFGRRPVMSTGGDAGGWQREVLSPRARHNLAAMISVRWEPASNVGPVMQGLIGKVWPTLILKWWWFYARKQFPGLDGFAQGCANSFGIPLPLGKDRGNGEFRTATQAATRSFDRPGRRAVRRRFA